MIKTPWYRLGLVWTAFALSACASLPPPTLPVTVTVGTSGGTNAVQAFRNAQSVSVRVLPSETPAPDNLETLARDALKQLPLAVVPDVIPPTADVIATLEFLTEVSKPETIVDRITQSGIWFGTGGSGVNLTFDLSGARVLSRAIRWRFVAANDATIQQEITARVDASRTWNERALRAVLAASLKDFPASPVNQRVIQQPLTDRP